MTASIKVPLQLPVLVAAHARERQNPVRYRPSSWERALEEVCSSKVLAVLRDEAITVRSERVATDRLLSRDAVCRVLDEVDLDDDVSLLRAFLLVQAWGAGTSGSRTLRHSATAFEHQETLVGSLRASAERLCVALGTHELAEVNRPGFGGVA